MLDRSSNETRFKETFEMKHFKDLKLPNDNFLKIYALPISNSKFDYKKLKEIVANNGVRIDIWTHFMRVYKKLCTLN